jgi:hypothetical protein
MATTPTAQTPHSSGQQLEQQKAKPTNGLQAGQNCKVLYNIDLAFYLYFLIFTL